MRRRGEPSGALWSVIPSPDAHSVDAFSDLQQGRCHPPRADSPTRIGTRCFAELSQRSRETAATDQSARHSRGRHKGVAYRLLLVPIGFVREEQVQNAACHFGQGPDGTRGEISCSMPRGSRVLTHGGPRDCSTSCPRGSAGAPVEVTR